MKSYYLSVKKKLKGISPSLDIVTCYYRDFLRSNDSREYKHMHIVADIYYRKRGFNIRVEVIEIFSPLTIVDWKTIYKMYVIRDEKHSKFIFRLDGHVAIPDYLKGKEAGNYHFDLEIKDQGKWEILNPPMPPATANSLDFLSFVETVLSSNDDIFDPCRWDLKLKKTLGKG